ncbi:hypothetical protein BS47DRAFT_1050060 [Hydnum rufescens UP504]|uniref:Uncharacterized protein n=1 Tax=Hydnum rufescens UP504 TaxID=1448309 RepID=A0A9P6AB13_9AGAM|nr:hypothetical protein BS47DRAFT_1050060 [Hydnum rufescens UP504]
MVSSRSPLLTEPHCGAGPTSLDPVPSRFHRPTAAPLIPPEAHWHKYRRSFISYPNATRSSNIYVHRLKNKIGMHPVPTAELSLSGAKGYLIGFLNEGIKTIYWISLVFILLSYPSEVSPGVFNCAFACLGPHYFLRCRSNTLLRDLPLHTCTLAKVSVLYHGLAHLTFGPVCLLRRSENGNGTVVPIAKGFVVVTRLGGWGNP